MMNSSLKKTTIIFLVCFVALFITNRLLDQLVERTSLDFLIIAIVKLILTYFIFNCLQSGQKKISSLFKNWHIFTIIILFIFYFSYFDTEEIISSNNLKINRSLHLSYIIECFSTGFFEEILFRVLIFYTLVNSNLFKTETHVFQSYIATSAVFGLCHLTNLFHYDLSSVINQIILAFGLGLIFQMLFTKYKNLLFIAALHALINYFGMRSSTLLQIKSNAGNSELTNVLWNFGVFIFIDLIILIYVYLFIKKRV